MTDQLTLQQVQQAMPPNLKNVVTQEYVDQINGIVSDPLVAEQVRNNFISYSKVLADGKFKTQDYLHAVTYASFKLMGMSNQEAYFRTFPDRHADLVAKGTSPKDISAYVSAYARGKLVNLIIEQSLVPTWVLNQDLHQRAINKLADLMMTAQSEKVQSDSANALLTHLAKPKEVQPLFNVNIGETSGMQEMRELITTLAARQRQIIEAGVIPAREVAAQRLIEGESSRVD